MRRKKRLTHVDRLKASYAGITAAHNDLQETNKALAADLEKTQTELDDAHEANKRLSAQLVDQRGLLGSVRENFRMRMLQSTLEVARLQGYIQRLNETELVERGPNSITTTKSETETQHRQHDGLNRRNADPDFAEVLPITGYADSASARRGDGIKHWLCI